MHDKTSQKTDDNRTIAPPVPATHPLRHLSQAEFAELGAANVVFVRKWSADVINQLLPEAEIGPDVGDLNLLMAADGRPVLVTDNDEALEDWLEEHPVMLAAVH